MAGCNCRTPISKITNCKVSILTRRDGRVQLAIARCDTERIVVSILTRRDGRVQPGDIGYTIGKGRVSILTRRDGRVQHFLYVHI